MSLRSSTSSIALLRVTGRPRDRRPGPRPRSHFAVRFGRGTAEDSKVVQRESQVRERLQLAVLAVRAGVDLGRPGRARLPPVQPRDRPLEPARATRSTSSSAKDASTATRATPCGRTPPPSTAGAADGQRVCATHGPPSSTSPPHDRPRGRVRGVPLLGLPGQARHRAVRPGAAPEQGDARPEPPDAHRGRLPARARPAAAGGPPAVPRRPSRSPHRPRHRPHATDPGEGRAAAPSRPGGLSACGGQPREPTSAPDGECNPTSRRIQDAVRSHPWAWRARSAPWWG